MAVAAATAGSNINPYCNYQEGQGERGLVGPIFRFFKLKNRKRLEKTGKDRKRPQEPLKTVKDRKRPEKTGKDWKCYIANDQRYTAHCHRRCIAATYRASCHRPPPSTTAAAAER